MLRRTTIAWAVVALWTGAAATATASATAKSTSTCTGQYVIPVDAATRRKASNALLCLVNRARAAHGLGRLRPARQLSSAATTHSKDMVAHKFVSHSSSTGDSVQQRVQRTGYHWLAVGETMAWGAGRGATAFKLVSTLLRSAVHRPIMLDRRYRDIGLGLVLGSPRGNPAQAATLTLVLASR